MSPATNRSDDSSAAAKDRTGYDPITDSFHAQYNTDTGEDGFIMTVVEAVAAIRGCEPTDLDPLFETVDPASIINALDGARGSDVEITFTYEQCCVTATSHGEIIVDPHFSDE